MRATTEQTGSKPQKLARRFARWIGSGMYRGRVNRELIKQFATWNGEALNTSEINKAWRMYREGVA
jgi:hypothetical protein